MVGNALLCYLHLRIIYEKFKHFLGNGKSRKKCAIVKI